MATMLPLDEAARRLHIHPATLRRRLHKGLARGTKQATPQGYVWMVELDDQAAQAAPESTQAAAQAAPTHDGLAQEVARLSDHVQDLRDQLKAREREVQELHVTINRLLLALPAPAPAVSFTDDTSNVSQGEPAVQNLNGAGPHGEEPRRWWERLGAWLSGAPAQPAGG